MYQKKRQSSLGLEQFALKDKLAQISEENRVLRSKIGKEEAKLKELVADVSHQLKTPLASLKMCYEIADTRSFTREEQRAFLAQGQREVTKLDNLIRSLVQISRLEANLIQISQIHVSLRKILHSVVNSVYMKAYDRGHSQKVQETEGSGGGGCTWHGRSSKLREAPSV